MSDIFSYIKTRVPMLDVARDYTTLKRAGTYWKGACPFHSERTPSFTVSPHREIFYCFGCQAGGDAIAFMARLEHCSQRDAARLLAERFNIELPQEARHQDLATDMSAKRTYYAVCEFFARWAHQLLKQDTAASAYLASRSLQSTIIDGWLIGYVPKKMVNHLIAQARNAQLMVSDLLAAKLLLEGHEGLYIPFEERIIFPIRDHMGRTVGFGGRVFMPGDERVKYYNTHDHQLFTKGQVLYGMDRAKKSIQQHNTACIVEGYMDCLALVQGGVPYVVATMGTACTQEQIMQLSRHTSRIYALYDGDSAGTRAVLKLSKLCWQVGLELFVVTLPKGADPASYMAQGGVATALLATAQDFFTYWMRVEQDSSEHTAPDRSHHIKEVVEAIYQISDPIRRELLLQQAAQTFSLPMATLHAAQNRQTPGSEQHPNLSGRPDAAAGDGIENKIFSVIISGWVRLSPELYTFLLRSFSERYRALIDAYYHFRRERPEDDVHAFIDILGDDDRALVLPAVIAMHEVELFDSLIERLYKREWKKLVNAVKMDIQAGVLAHEGHDAQQALRSFQEAHALLLKKGGI